MIAMSVFVKQPRRAKMLVELEAMMIGSILWQTPKKVKHSIKTVASSWSNSWADNDAHTETWCCERAILHLTAKQQHAGRLLCLRLWLHCLQGQWWPRAKPQQSATPGREHPNTGHCGWPGWVLRGDEPAPSPGQAEEPPCSVRRSGLGLGYTGTLTCSLPKYWSHKNMICSLSVTKNQSKHWFSSSTGHTPKQILSLQQVLLLF